MISADYNSSLCALKVLVFVHARKATVRTAQALLELARNGGETHLFDTSAVTGFAQAQKQVQQGLMCACLA